MYQVGGLYWGLGTLVTILITIACIGTYFLPEAELDTELDIKTTGRNEATTPYFSE